MLFITRLVVEGAPLTGDDEPASGYDLVVFGRVTLLIAPDHRKAWALCQPGWDADDCPDWGQAVRYLDHYGLADVEIDHLTDWRPNPDGSDTFILRPRCP